MKKILNRLKEVIRENKNFILVLILLTLTLNLQLPYYVMTPGGLINTSERVEIDGKNLNGSYNMMYVSERKGTVMSVLLSFLINEWDIESINESRISNETENEIDIRNKTTLENSLQNAVFLAYQENGLDIKINNSRNIVVGITEKSVTNLKIGDIIQSYNGRKINNLDEYREIVSESEVGEEIHLEVLRDSKEIDCYAKVYLENNTKLTGLAIITNYDYETNPLINFKFDENESGASGGLMLALSIYDLLNEEDLLRGRKIAGTGAILENGEVEEIAGIKYKLLGASKENADVIFVPVANYNEAVDVKNEYNLTLEIIPVETFYDAVSYLKKG